MKRAADALGWLITRLVAELWPEAAFALAGTGLLAIGSSYLSPAGPWLVVGAVSLIVGIALSLPRRTT